MNILARLLLAITGLVSLFVTVIAWFQPGDFATQLQLAITGPVGEAAVRADVGGLFASIGVFALLAAWKQSRTIATLGLIPVSAALIGRFIGLALSGAGEGTLSPMVVEAVIIGIFALARHTFSKQPEGL